MQVNEVYIGVDVSKESLEVSSFDQGRSTLPNTPRGIRSLLSRVQKLELVPLICCEATGGYEKRLVSLCHELNVPVAVVNARQVRDYAKSKGILAKTDAIDAAVLAGYAQQNHPRLTQKPEPWRLRLKALHQRRESLKEMILQEGNRLEHPEDAFTVAQTRKHIRFLKRQITDVDAEILKLVQEEEEATSFCERFMSVNGVGIIVASSFVAFLPEMGRVTDNELVALVGLAPHCQESGNWKGQRHISGGRSPIRKILYMPALNATSTNPILKDFYDRLVTKGKPKKVAITAVMRKMVCLANRIASDPEFMPA